MRVRRIAGVAAAAALAGGLLTTALPASAATEPDTVTITNSKLLAPWEGASLWLKCPDSHPYFKRIWWEGPYVRSVSPPAGFPGYRQQATFFFNNSGTTQSKMASIWMECTPVMPS
ncbi:hypothetical protein ACFQVD_32760 [Streptosporangium amethystogenes subsp. fukuiense]|uniref:Ig-like domain-containing protein n=1 Tax=Streptosporangium amethystogenes subsp. fukuiense TaxID=698418 RepID=A0ABW2T8R1_9ACTN